MECFIYCINFLTRHNFNIHACKKHSNPVNFSLGCFLLFLSSLRSVHQERKFKSNPFYVQTFLYNYIACFCMINKYNITLGSPLHT